MAGFTPAPYAAEADETVKCPSCGKMNDTDAHFCDQCGAALSGDAPYSPSADETVKCPDCGKMNAPDASYCDQCGAKLIGSDATRSEFTSPFEFGGLFVRSMMPGPGLSDMADSKPATLYGKLAVFDEWAEIKSRQEGHFLERIARGAFTKTLRDNRKVPVLFQHGEDPQIGGKPLGKISRLEETDKGVEYEVELFDTDYVRSILPALKAGEFGSSFTFNPVKDKTGYVSFPQRSSYNPERIPEVTHHEVKMREFGPGIMPYYSGANAGVRSATDEFLWGRFTRDPEWMRARLTPAEPVAIVPAEVALSNERAEDEPHSGAESRNVPLVPVRKRFEDDQGWLDWLNALK